MPLLGKARSFLSNLFSPHHGDGDLHHELRAYLDLLVEEKIRSGLSREEAERAARLELGGIEQVKEQVREQRLGNWLYSVLSDFRYALRQLRKNPGFTAVAVLTLALGIGANTAIFSYVDAWIIRPLPYPQADRLMIFQLHDKQSGWTRNLTSSAADFSDFQRQNTSFEQTVPWTSANFNLTGDGPPLLLEGGRVGWNYFDALGAKPILGRTFTPDEDRAVARVVILSEGLWKSRFAADRRIVGRVIAIGGEQYTVVGVMPATFQFPLMGVANLWTPLALADTRRADRSNAWLPVFGRLKPGVTAEQAGSEAAAILARFEREFPQTNTNLTWLVRPMADEVRTGEGTHQLMISFVIVGLVLLIACANVANLVLARSTGRIKEFALRGALGATRRRLGRQLLTESLLLFALGGLAGMLLGVWGAHWIESQIPDHTRGHLVNYGHVELDLTTLAFTVATTLLCGLTFGLVPIFENSSIDVNSTLKETARQDSGSQTSARLRRIFVIAETALAVVVVISATLLVKSFIISVHSSPGYNPANVMVAQLGLPKTKYPEPWRQRNFGDEVLARLRALPQAASVGVASSVPYGGFGQGVEVQAADKPANQPGQRQGAGFYAVSPDYFSTMQIALVEGRTFDSRDAPGNAPAAIINETFAHQFWLGEDPIGRQLRFADRHTVCTIVGVVRDIKMYYLREPPGRQLYVPLAQFPSATFGFVVRTAGDPTTVAMAIRDVVWSVDHDQPISSVEPLEALISAVNAGDRLVARMMILLGALALFLGIIGIYGVIAHLVSQRSREIGIRMALGASPTQVFRMVVGQGLRLALMGIALGLLGALGATRLLAAALYQVTPSDPPTYVGVTILFALVATAACYIPARRGMTVEPIVALRSE